MMETQKKKKKKGVTHFVFYSNILLGFARFFLRSHIFSQHKCWIEEEEAQGMDNG